MKFRSLFDLVGDSKDVVDFFDQVETVPQMVSRLERMKQGEAEDFLVCIHALKLSIESALDDTLEMGGGVDLDDDEPDIEEADLDELEKDEGDKTEENGPGSAAKG